MKRLWNFAKHIATDEQGAEGLEKIMIIAAVVLPLLGLLIYFRNDIQNWVSGNMEAVKGDADTWDPTTTGL